jgi:hypothetical protein
MFKKIRERKGDDRAVVGDLSPPLQYSSMRCKKRFEPL